MIEGIIVEGLIYSLMVLGVYITFRFLDFPDLTVDGSFPLGAAITAFILINGINTFLSPLIAFLAGCIAGIITSLIHTKLKVPNLLSGILTMTMLYSINIRIMDNRANISLLKVDTIFSILGKIFQSNKELVTISFLLIFIILIKFVIDCFFITDLGLSLRAIGNNESFIIQLGINPEILKMIGLALSNGLVAISGSIWAQYQGFSDVGMGQGIIIAGLASVMLGEFFIFSKKSVILMTSAAILGSIIYRAIMYFGRFYGYYINMTPNDLKLLTGLLIILSILFSKIRKREIK